MNFFSFIMCVIFFFLSYAATLLNFKKGNREFGILCAVATVVLGIATLFIFLNL